MIVLINAAFLVLLVTSLVLYLGLSLGLSLMSVWWQLVHMLGICQGIVYILSVIDSAQSVYVTAYNKL